jgi:hypothetical protein
MKKLLLYIGFIFLIIFEVLRVYLIMPMPGSQQFDSISLAYFLGSNKVYIRIILYCLIAYPFLLEFKNGKKPTKGLLIAMVLFYIGIFYAFTFVMEADKMFYQPSHKFFQHADQNKISQNKLVIGISSEGVSKAYPIQLIGYHHQVVDTIANTPVMVTYCTVCRTGRVFHPEVNGKVEQFRLVGMDHFNAMFEDATTKSWWAQATGECIAGPLKGYKLKEFPSEQLQLGAWLNKYPTSQILQPDEKFMEQFAQMDLYDKGVSKGTLTKRDTASWKFKSWVIGVESMGNAKTYDWNMLVSDRIIEDSLTGLPLLLVLENDTASFHAFSRQYLNETLKFKLNGDTLTDINTGSFWEMNGNCIDGKLKGAVLSKVAAYQEFLHSWEYFHPNALRHDKNKSFN